MTKRILSFAFIIILCFSLSLTAMASEDTYKFYDEVGVVSAEKAYDYADELDALSEKYKVEVSIAVIEVLDTSDIDDFIEIYYDTFGLGYGENHDGIFLLIAMDQREFRILSNGIGADALSEGEIDSITESITPYLSDGDYAAAFDYFISECEYQIDGEINGFPFKPVQSIIISVVIGFVIAFIVTGNMKNKLKSVRKQDAAAEYTKQGSMQLVTSNDFFLYRTVKREEPEDELDELSFFSRFTVL